MGNQNYEIIQAQEERIAELETSGSTDAQSVAIRVKPENDCQFIEYQKQAEEILKYAKAAVVTNDAEMKASTNDLSIIRMLKKGIEEHRQVYVRPINEHVKTINQTYKLLTDPIEQADKITGDKILAYRAEVERKRREAEAINQAKLDLARREAELSGTGEITVDITPVIVPEAPPNHVRAEAGTLGMTKNWKFEVTDFALLPNEYKLPDLVKIGKVVRAGVNIPGVKSWQEDGIRITR